MQMSTFDRWKKKRNGGVNAYLIIFSPKIGIFWSYTCIFREADAKLELKKSLFPFQVVDEKIIDVELISNLD